MKHLLVLALIALPVALAIFGPRLTCSYRHAFVVGSNLLSASGTYCGRWSTSNPHGLVTP